MHSASPRISPSRLALWLGGPVAIALGCWIYLAMMIGDMSNIPGMSSMMMKPHAFNPIQFFGQFFGLFLMWTIMMAAMMLPTAVPMIMAYARMRAGERRRSAPWLSVLMFSGGYLAAWSAFSLGATLLQTGLTDLALLSPMMMQLPPGPLAGGVLIAAGVYQLMPLKQACLSQCRTPIAFLMTQWREGNWGGFVMGWRHGLFCVGCCWALMGILFVTGIMNSAWIIAITLYVLIEKVVPHSQTVSTVAGISMIGMGIWTVLA
ncbi:MAG: DUF2182 domain-containing protein [Rhodospirillales bacterium]|nr:DUF2182 domain-containing protein [Rhodospirillales bacterium]